MMPTLKRSFIFTYPELYIMAIAGVVLGKELGIVVAMAAPSTLGIGLKPVAVDNATANGQATEAAPVLDAG